LKSKILHKFHGLLFVFLAFLTSFFFPISPIHTYQKIRNIFMVFYSTYYRFYQRILKSSWIFIKKNRDIWNTKHFQNSIVYYLLFYLFFYFWHFFSILPMYSCQKILNFFVLFYCMDQRFYQRILQNYGFFSSKSLNYLKSKMSPKLHCLLFLFYFFIIFDIFFFYFTYPKLSKNYGIYWSVLLEELGIL